MIATEFISTLKGGIIYIFPSARMQQKQCFLCCINSFIFTLSQAHIQLNTYFQIICVMENVNCHLGLQTCSQNRQEWPPRTWIPFFFVLRLPEVNANSHGQCHLCVPKYPHRRKVAPGHSITDLFLLSFCWSYLPIQV